MPSDACVRRCVRSSRLVGRVPLGQPASLHRLRAGRPALFGGFVGTTELSDFPRSFIIGVCPWTSRCGLRRSSPQATAGSPGSRTRCFHACTGSLTARGPGAPRDGGASGVAFRLPIRRRHPEVATTRAVGHPFAAQYPARTFPCQRFADAGLPRRRMTRGRCGSLLLQRFELASIAPRRICQTGARALPRAVTPSTSVPAADRAGRLHPPTNEPPRLRRPYVRRR
jgi:hypothetical protein